MDCNRDEALRARGIAEEKMLKNDFEGARKFALKAKQLFPELENISQVISVCDIHCSAQKKVHGAEKDFYGILQVENVADEVTIRKQYRKLALVLHPDKNKFPGAEAAFKFIGEANMILSDKGKRSVYDMKCRDPARGLLTKVQNRQGNQNSYAQNKVKTGSSSQFNSVNHRHQSTTSVRLTFWTYCPFCHIKYEYYRDFVNKPLRCQQCSKLFIAHDIGAQGAAPRPGFMNDPSANLGVNQAKPPFSQQKEGGKGEQVKVNIQKDDQFSSRSAHQTSKTENTEVGGSSKTMGRESEKEGLTKVKINIQKPNETGTSKVTNRKRGRKRVVDSSDSDSDADEAFDEVDSRPVGDSGNRRCSARQKQHVSYRENGGDGLSPLKRSKVNKSSDGVEYMKKEEKTCNAADVDNADVSMPNGVKHDDHSESDSEPELVDCRDSEFSNFDKDKEEHCFAVNQIWACYDSFDGMPRFYAHIRRVHSSGFQLGITWLEPEPENEPEIKWAEEELPVACGKFVHGDSEKTKDRLMFSHQIAYKQGGRRSSFLIYPQKGEVWALFKDWDIKWSLNPESHKKFKFDIVEILSVNDDSISVVFLLKVKRFVSVFQRTIWAGHAEHKIPLNELLRFSHRIKSVKLSGTERAGVPAGSFELDTASLPDDLDEYYYSNNVNTASQSPEEVKPASNLASTPKKQMNGLDKGMLNLRRSPRGLKGGDTNMIQENAKPHVNGIKEEVSDGSKPFCKNGDLDTISKKFAKSPKISSPTNSVQISHDFSSDKQIQKFKVGQIWAFWEHNKGVRQCFAQIKKIEFQPVRVYVTLLKLSDALSNHTIRYNACGLFKLCGGRPKLLPLDSFSHVVTAEASGHAIFNIYPRAQQIWAMYRKQDAEPTSADLKVGEFDIVEVLETEESGIQVMSLTRVPGHKLVFKAPSIQRSTIRVAVIPRVEVNRFSHQIPAFRYTEEKVGCLRGCWELDPSALAGLPLLGSSQG